MLVKLWSLKYAPHLAYPLVYLMNSAAELCHLQLLVLLYHVLYSI